MCAYVKICFLVVLFILIVSSSARETNNKFSKLDRMHTYRTTIQNQKEVNYVN